MNQLPCPESKIIESTANIAKTIHTIQSEPVAKSANFIYILLLKFHFLNFINLKLLFLIAFENHYKSNHSNNYPDKSKWEIATTCQYSSIHFCATCT